MTSMPAMTLTSMRAVISHRAESSHPPCFDAQPCGSSGVVASGDHDAASSTSTAPQMRSRMESSFGVVLASII
eukprot:1847872-Rhodomonas_salina.1